MLWCGEDGVFGTDDDQRVFMFEAKGEDGKTELQYWIHLGQNIGQQVLGPTTLGPMTGGGPDKDPTTDPVRPVYDNTENDGQYYIGPLDTPLASPSGPENKGYFYGDSQDSNNSNNMVLSTPREKHDSDDKFILEDDKMIISKPAASEHW
jgi:hypothetical protein